jgi:hypothetical protein
LARLTADDFTTLNITTGTMIQAEGISPFSSLEQGSVELNGLTTMTREEGRPGQDGNRVTLTTFNESLTPGRDSGASKTRKSSLSLGDSSGSILNETLSADLAARRSANGLGLSHPPSYWSTGGLGGPVSSTTVAAIAPLAVTTPSTAASRQATRAIPNRNEAVSSRNPQARVSQTSPESDDPDASLGGPSFIAAQDGLAVGDVGNLGGTATGSLLTFGTDSQTSSIFAPDLGQPSGNRAGEGEPGTLTIVSAPEPSNLALIAQGAFILPLALWVRHRSRNRSQARERESP